MLLARNGHFRWRSRHLVRDRPDADTLRLTRPDAARGSTDPDATGPVFVDSTGRRGRTIRRVAYGLGALCAAYTVVLVLSFMGATPFAPKTMLPVPGVPSGEPGTVGETTRPDLPGTPTSPRIPSASPTDVPGLPVPTPSASGTASSPGAGEPSGTATTSGPSGTPSASPSSPSTSESPTTSPAESGSSPPESPTTTTGGTGTPSTDESATSAAAPSGGASPAASGGPVETLSDASTGPG